MTKSVEFRMERSKLREYQSDLEYASFHLNEAANKWIEFKKTIRRAKWENMIPEDKWALLAQNPQDLILETRRWANKVTFYDLKVQYYTLKVST